MLGVIINEKRMCEDALKYKELSKRPMSIIRLIIKKYLSEGKPKDEVYKLINNLMLETYEGYNHNDWKNILKKAIEGVEKTNNLKLVNIEEIHITKEEWDIVLKLEDDRLERLAFILLVYQKINEIINPTSNGWINIGMSNIFKESKIQRKDESKKLLFILKEKGYISKKNSCDSESIKINYNIIGENFIKIDSFEDLSIITYYEEFKNNEDWESCENCSKRFKPKSNKNKYCSKCAKEIEKELTRKRVENFRNKKM